MVGRCRTIGLKFYDQSGRSTAHNANNGGCRSIPIATSNGYSLTDEYIVKRQDRKVMRTRCLERLFLVPFSTSKGDISMLSVYTGKSNSLLLHKSSLLLLWIMSKKGLVGKKMCLEAHPAPVLGMK